MPTSFTDVRVSPGQAKDIWAERVRLLAPYQFNAALEHCQIAGLSGGAHPLEGDTPGHGRRLTGSVTHASRKRWTKMAVKEAVPRHRRINYLSHGVRRWSS